MVCITIDTQLLICILEFYLDLGNIGSTSTTDKKSKWDLQEKK